MHVCQNAVTLKHLAVGRNRLKFETRGLLVVQIWVALILGHPLHLLFIKEIVSKCY